MEITSIPIIILVCYLFGEVFKVVFKKKKNLYKLIPVLVSFLGGILGILIFFTAPTMILNANNFWVALCIGIISGASSTTTNQIIKQVFNLKGEEK